MKKPFFLLAVFFIFLSTYNPNIKNIQIPHFNIKQIILEHDEIIDKDLLKKQLNYLYEENLFFLNNENIKKKIKNLEFVESFTIKKIYPNTLKLTIKEKEFIAILIKEKKKYFISDNGNIVKYKDINKFEDLPTVLNGGDRFFSMYQNLKNTNFPIEMIKSYYFFESGRWDLIIEDNKVIKLPIKDYKKSLKNFMKIISSKEFNEYSLFDYRIKDQIILN